jgi:hypothetical protein
MAKPKRKLTEVNFQKEGAHVALVSKQQGGPANGHDYALIMKSLNFSEEAIQKMQQIRVTLELPEFLRKFFGMYYEDAEVLAALLGYVKPETDDNDWNYEDYIKERVESFEILKSLHESKNLVEVLSTLDENKYLSMLKDQSMLEKAFDKQNSETKVSEEGSTEAVAKAKESDEMNAKVDPSGSNQQITKVSDMDEKEIEVLKSQAAQAADLQKSLEQTQADLQKALAQIEEIEKARKEAITKAKTDKVASVVKTKDYLDVITKAALSLESDEDFEGFLKAVEAIEKATDSSELFSEKGADASDEGSSANTESPVARVLKAQFNKK